MQCIFVGLANEMSGRETFDLLLLNIVDKIVDVVDVVDEIHVFLINRL